MIDCYDILRSVTVVVLRSETNTVLNSVDAVRGGEAIVIGIGICRVVIKPHRSVIVVLIKTAGVVAYGETMMDKKLMICITATHLKAVTVTLTRVFG